MDNNETAEIKDILIRLKDSYQGYKEAGEAATQERHKKMFGDLAAKRHEYFEDLRKMSAGHGEDVDDIDGSFEASVHRFFMNMSHKLDKENDEELLEAITSGEENLLKQYDDAIKEVKTDTDILEKLQNHRHEIASNLDLMSAKEEAA